MQLVSKKTFIEAQERPVTSSLRARSESPKPQERDASIEEARRLYDIKHELVEQRVSGVVERAEWQIPSERVRLFARRAQTELDKIMASLRSHEVSLPRPEGPAEALRKELTEQFYRTAETLNDRKPEAQIEAKNSRSLPYPQGEQVKLNHLEARESSDRLGLKPGPIMEPSSSEKPKVASLPTHQHPELDLQFPEINRALGRQEQVLRDSLKETAEHPEAAKRRLAQIGKELTTEYYSSEANLLQHPLFEKYYETVRLLSGIRLALNEYDNIDKIIKNPSSINDTRVDIEKMFEEAKASIERLSDDVHISLDESFTELVIQHTKKHIELSHELNSRLAVRKTKPSPTEKRRLKLLESQVKIFNESSPLVFWQKRVDEDRDIEAVYLIGRIALQDLPSKPSDLAKASCYLKTAAQHGHFLAQKVLWKMTPKLDPLQSDFQERVDELVSELNSGALFSRRKLLIGDLFLKGHFNDSQLAVRTLKSAAVERDHIAGQMLGQHYLNSAKILRSLPGGERNDSFLKKLKDAERSFMRSSAKSWESQKKLAEIAMIRAELGIDREVHLNLALYWLFQGIIIGHKESIEGMAIAFDMKGLPEFALDTLESGIESGQHACYITKSRILASIGHEEDAIVALTEYFHTIKKSATYDKIRIDEATDLAIELSLQSQTEASVKLIMSTLNLVNKNLVHEDKATQLKGRLSSLLRANRT